MKSTYELILWSQLFDYVSVLKDGIYNGLYNKEPAVFRIKGGEPVFVQFVGNSSIFDKKGILLSSVELLVPAEKLVDAE